MKEEAVRQVQAVQADMATAAEPYFGEAELDDLRCVVRLSVEFFLFLQDWNSVSLDPFEIRYACESAYSGIDSFCGVSTACRGSGLSMTSTLEWAPTSPASLKEQYLSRYREFSVEPNFDRRCRLLLDLFKLQMVFAAMSYD